MHCHLFPSNVVAARNQLFHCGKVEIYDTDRFIIFITCHTLYYFSDVTFDKDITPYIHVFIYHSFYFAQKYGPLKAFEMEAVEQLNYVNKMVFFGCSNHGKDNATITEQVIFKF